MADPDKGLSIIELKGVPKHSLTPIRNLGVLVVASFILAIITGIIIMPHYSPTPQENYISIMRVYRRLPYGSLIITMHIYTAYAIVLLSAALIMRSYFTDEFEKPRQYIWLINVFSYIIVVGLCFTGFFLPWFASSKAFTDSSIRFLESVPFGEQITKLFFPKDDYKLLSNLANLHTKILPLTLSVIILLKIYLNLRLDSPKQTAKYPKKDSEEVLPFFPGVASYLVLISSVLIAGIMVISAVFPFSLPSQFEVDAEISSTPKLQWYLLWIYNLIKMFETSSTRVFVFLIVVTLGLAFTLLPFYYKPKHKPPFSRTIHTAIGLLIIIEISLLTIWKIIPKIFHSSVIIELIILSLPVMLTLVYMTKTRIEEEK